MSNYKTPLSAIRSKCLECCCGSSNEVKLCGIEDCSLYAFRFGKNPYRKQTERSLEQIEELRERGRKLSEVRKRLLSRKDGDNNDQ